MKSNVLENNIIVIFVLLLISFGIYLSFIGGYGSDEDTLPMIYVFESKYYSGTFVSSRFTGNPVAELGIGFLAFFFGSFAANLVTFLFLVFGLIFFFLTLNKKFEINELFLFLLLCLTSPILFFDNIEPIDYSWALLFFSLGSYFYSKKIFELSILFFAFCIGTRINYLLFILAFIIFFENDSKIYFKRKIIIFLCSFIMGGLFYLPIWFDNSFDLSWLTAARPTDQGLLGLASRFFYKTYITTGYLVSLILFVILLKYFSKLKSIENKTLIFSLILSNLLIFFWIPAEYSYLQIYLIALLYLVYKLRIKKLLYLICICHFFSWFVSISFLEINHKDNTYCGPKNAISAKIKFQVDKGYLSNYLKSREKISCWVHGEDERSLKILEGKSLKKQK